MSSEPFNILISSAGRRVALLRLFRQALANLGLDGRVLAVDMTRASSAFQSADAGFVVPRCTDPSFVPRMLELCRTHAVKLLIPTIDPELPVYAAHREDFAAIGTHVHVSPPDAIAIASDKRRTHAWLTAEDLPTVGQADQPRDVLDQPDAWPWPLIAKPTRGSSATGIAIVDTPAALAALTDGKDYIVQTLAQGVEYTVSTFIAANGDVVCAVPRRRLQVRAGEVSKGITCRHPAVEALAMDVARALPGARGAINVQIFHDPDTGDLNIIEINPRFGGGFPLAWQAGAHYPTWLIEERLGLPSSAAGAWRDRLVMLRFDDAVFVDADDVDL